MTDTQMRVKKATRKRKRSNQFCEIVGYMISPTAYNVLCHLRALHRANKPGSSLREVRMTVICELKRFGCIQRDANGLYALTERGEMLYHQYTAWLNSPDPDQVIV